MPLGAFADLFGAAPTTCSSRSRARSAMRWRSHSSVPTPLPARSTSGRSPLRRTSCVSSRDRAGPVLLAIDDVQWLDPTSAAVVAFAARPSRRSNHRIPRDEACHRHRAGTARARRCRSTRAVRAHDRRPAIARRAPPTHGGPPRVPIATAHPHPDRAGLRGQPVLRLGDRPCPLRSGVPVTPGKRLPVPPTLDALIGQRIGSLPAATRKVLVLTAAAIETPRMTRRRERVAGTEVAFHCWIDRSRKPLVHGGDRGPARTVSRSRRCRNAISSLASLTRHESSP
jgi:hypothetical protein